MPPYRVIQDINSGKNPIGSTIELTEEQAAAISWAVEPLETAEVEPEVTEDKGDDEDAKSFVIGEEDEEQAAATEERTAPRRKGRGKK